MKANDITTHPNLTTKSTLFVHLFVFHQWSYSKTNKKAKLGHFNLALNRRAKKSKPGAKSKQGLTLSSLQPISS
jgi:hypothetical protein